MTNTQFTIGKDKKTLQVERTFNAPCSKLWAAYSREDLFTQWWGPIGWETEVTHMDVRVNGYCHYGMKCVDEKQKDWFGKTSWGKMTYTKITPEELLAYTDEFCDADGNVTPDMPVSRTKLEFHQHDDTTKLVSTTVYDSPEALEKVLEMGMKEGFTQTWDRLEEFTGQKGE